MDFLQSSKLLKDGKILDQKGKILYLYTGEEFIKIHETKEDYKYN